jgi:hypothetical protein
MESILAMVAILTNSFSYVQMLPLIIGGRGSMSEPPRRADRPLLARPTISSPSVAKLGSRTGNEPLSGLDRQNNPEKVDNIGNVGGPHGEEASVGCGGTLVVGLPDSPSADALLEDPPEEEVVPLVKVGFPNRISKAADPFVSAPNTEGFSMITKVELVSHFLPVGWEGVIRLKPAIGRHDTVALSHSMDPDGNGLMWSLGLGDYIMEAISKKVAPIAGGCSNRRGPVAGTRTASVGLGGIRTRSFHSAASSFGSASAARLSGRPPLFAPSFGIGNNTRTGVPGASKGQSLASPTISSPVRGRMFDWGSRPQARDMSDARKRAKVLVEDLLPFMKVGGMSGENGGKSAGEAPEASEKPAAILNTFFR